MAYRISGSFGRTSSHRFIARVDSVCRVAVYVCPSSPGSDYDDY